MAVAFDAVGPSSSGAGNLASTSLTWSHTITGANTVLLVGVGLGATSDAGLSTTVTYNGVSMTSLLPKVHCGGITAGYLEVFGIIAPANAGANVVVTVAGGTPASLDCGSLSFSGAGQTIGTAFGTPTSANTPAPTTTPGITLASNTNGNIIAGFICAGSGIASFSGAGTSRYIINEDPGSTAGGCAAGATAPATGSSVTMTWSATSDDFAGIILEVLPAAGGGPAAYPAQGGQAWRRRFRHTQASTGGFPAATVTGLTAQVTVNAETGSIATAVPYQPPALQPGISWLRRIRHQQHVPTAAPAVTVTGVTAQVTVNAETGSIATAVPYAPQPLQAGQTWARVFRHRQQPATAAPAATILGVTAQVTVGAETGAVATSVPYVPPAAVPGRTWLRTFRHRQQDAGPQAPSAPTTTVTGLTAQVTVNAETGAVSTAVPYQPQQLQPGQAWRRLFTHRQQPATAAAAATVLGVTAQVTVNAETGAVQTAVPYQPPASVPGQTWVRFFRHRQQDAGPQAPSAPVTTVTGVTAQVTVNAETGSIATAVPYQPPALQPGISWRRLFTHRQQPATTARAVTVTGLTAQVTVNAETGAVQTVPGAPQTPLTAAPGRTWLRFFRHAQQPPTAAAAAPPPVPGTATITNTLAAAATLTDTLANTAALSSVAAGGAAVTSQPSGRATLTQTAPAATIGSSI